MIKRYIKSESGQEGSDVVGVVDKNGDLSGEIKCLQDKYFPELMPQRVHLKW